MSKSMIRKLAVVIVLLAVFAVLLGASFALNETAYKNMQEDHLELLQTLLPSEETFVVVPYDGEDANIVSVHKAENGFVIETVTYGYAGEITMFIGVNNDGKVTGLVVRDLSETFGLGKEALTDHVFLKQFLNF